MGQNYCTYSFTMGYKGQKIGKRHFLAIFARQHSLKMLPVYCGNISYDVVTALAHFKSATISFSSLSRCGFSCFFLCPRKHKASHISTLFFSQPHSDCIHSFYLFVSTSRIPGMSVESRQKLQQRTGCRPLWDVLFPIYWVPWQFSVWPVDAVCVRPNLGLALGPCALFHILYDVYTSVYNHLLLCSLWTIFESFPPPFCLLHPFLYLSASIHRQAVVAFILCVCGCFFFSHKVHCNLTNYVFILSFKFPATLIWSL